MKVKQLRRYRRAKYPRGTFYRPPPKRPFHRATEGGVISLLLLALTEACDPFGVGTTGPPPVMPDMVTEAEARAIIDRIFSDNGVVLEKDFPLLFRWAQDSLAFDVDGFNDSIQVGYEYVDPEGESPSLSSSFQAAVDSAGNSDGPYIKLVHPAFADGRQEEWFEMEIEAFIQKLKTMGII